MAFKDFEDFRNIFRFASIMALIGDVRWQQHQDIIQTEIDRLEDEDKKKNNGRGCIGFLIKMKGEG